jgi:hypothetical protein
VAAALESADPKGERRTIHRRPYRRVKPTPKRPSMLDPQSAEIAVWLDAEPALTAIDILARLKARDPDRFAHHRLRTVQRLVKVRRTNQAKRVMRCGTAALEAAIAADIVAPSPPSWLHRDLPRVAAPDP